MSKLVYSWIANASILSPLIPLVCLFIYRKNQPKQNLILAISLCLSFIFDVIGWTLAVQHKHNTISNNLYFIVSFPAIMFFYHETLIKKSFKILIRIFTICFLAFALIFAFDQGLKVLNFNTFALSSVLVTITSLFFVNDLNRMDDSNFTKIKFHETNIILNTSLALYYFGTIFIFCLSYYVTTEDGRVLWGFHNAIQILKNIGVAFAFYLAARRGLALDSFTKSRVRSSH